MIAGAVLVTAIACLRCLGNGFVIDDNALIVHNSAIAGWSFPWKSLGREEFWFGDYSDLPHFRNYRPLLLVWLWLNYHLFGLSAPWWHASIIAVHLAAVWLVFKIAKRLTREPGSALLAAFLFGLIPIHGQALAWMSACGLVLGTTLELAAFCLIMIRSEAERRNWALALAFYAGALLCHESAIVFPGLVACYAFLIESPQADTAAGSVAPAPEPFPARVRRALLCAVPLAVDLLIYLIVRRMVLGVLFKGSFEPANLLTRAQDVMTVPMVLAIYLTLLVAPWLALPNHRVLPVTSVASPGFWMPLGALLALGAVLLMVWRHSSRRGLYLFCAAWVGLSLAPMMGLRALYHLVQDMYLYLPSVGWCILLADLVGRFSQRGLLPRRLALGGAAALLGVYAVALWRVVPFWHDDVTAAAGYVAGFPESVVWHGNLGMMLEKQGDSAGADASSESLWPLSPIGPARFIPIRRRCTWPLGSYWPAVGTSTARLWNSRTAWDRTIRALCPSLRALRMILSRAPAPYSNEAIWRARSASSRRSLLPTPPMPALCTRWAPSKHSRDISAKALRKSAGRCR